VSEKVGADYNFGQYSAHNSELYSVCVCMCVSLYNTVYFT